MGDTVLDAHRMQRTLDKIEENTRPKRSCDDLAAEPCAMLKNMRNAKDSEIMRLRIALRDLAGGMVTLNIADKLSGPVERAWAALPPEMRLGR